MASMVIVAQLNVVVSDLERSRNFYQRLGFSFRRRSRLGVEAVEAWVSDNAGVTVVLHSLDFATWWDPNTPGAVAGGPQVDLELESVELLESVVEDIRSTGAAIAKEPTDMPWGQRFAIIIDPDGHRIGLKAPPAES